MVMRPWPYELPNPAQPHLTGHLRGPLLVGDTACPTKLAPCMTAVRGQVRMLSRRGLSWPPTPPSTPT